jgi:hypothetical protein
VYNCAIFELCIELKNYHILNVSIRLQVDDHPKTWQHDAADTEDNGKKERQNKEEWYLKQIGINNVLIELEEKITTFWEVTLYC